MTRMSTLPASVRLSLWITAAWAGRTSVPEALAAALPDVDDVAGDVDRLTLWGELGERVLVAALPRPGPLVGEAAEAVPAGATVLPYPYPSYATNVAMLWQIDSGMRFTMPGGEVYVPGHEGRSTNYPRSGLPPGLWSVLVPARPPYPWRWHAPGPARRRHLVAVLRTYVATHHVDAMVVSTTGAQGRWVEALVGAGVALVVAARRPSAGWWGRFP